MNLFAPLVSLLLLMSASPSPVPSVAAAAPTQDPPGYCRFVEGVAQSQGDLQLSPDLYAYFGVVNGADALTQGGVTLPPTWRLTIGASYSASNLYQAFTERSQALAECRRYELVDQLWAFVIKQRGLKSSAGLRAKALVISAALPKATEILRVTREAVRQEKATISELNATELRVANLRAEAAELEEESEGLEPLPSPTLPLTELLSRRDQAELEVERYDAKLREARAFDLQLRAGYDQVYGVRDHLPLFGVVALSFIPGGLWQPAAEARAASGRVDFVHEHIWGVDQRLGETVRRLRAQQAGEAKRLAEAKLLRADLEERLRTVAAVSDPRVVRFHDLVWFDLIQVEADEAYARAHLEELSTLLGNP